MRNSGQRSSTWKYCLETVKVYLQDPLEQVKIAKEKQAIKNIEETILEEVAV